MFLRSQAEEQRQRIKIYHCRGYSEQRGVKPVEHSAVTGQYGTAVFYANSAFEEALHQVAPCTEYDYGKSEANPLEHVKPKIIHSIFFG